MDLCELTRQIWQCYLSDQPRERQKLLDLMAENCIVFGTGGQEAYLNRQEFARALDHVVRLNRQNGLHYSYEDFWTKENKIEPSVATVCGGLKLTCTGADGVLLFEMRSRFTFVFARGQKGWQVQHIHHSVANQEQLAGEYYPETLIARIQECQQKIRELKKLAQRDELTGLINLRTLREIFSCRSQAGAWLVMVDVDNFKKVNDQFGHVAGNEVLVKVAQLLSGCVRDEDAVARVGGDEFVMLLGKMNRDIAVERLEQIMAAMEQAGKTRDCWVSLSMGAVQVQTGEALKDAISRADVLLYATKDKGKNNYSIA